MYSEFKKIKNCSIFIRFALVWQIKTWLNFYVCSPYEVHIMNNKISIKNFDGQQKEEKIVKLIGV